MATSLPKPNQPITSQFLTYATKPDPSNTDTRFLVAGSKNTLINDSEKIKSREGFTLQSLAGTTNNPILSSTDWADSSGDNWSLRAHDAVLEFYISGNWETLMDTLTSVTMIFDPYYDNTEKIDRLLWCDGTPDLKDWSGATATLSLITATTLTLQGTKTFGQKRFLTTGTRAIRIKDDLGVWHRSVYTGGEGTTTLTGLATDLTGFPFTGGNLIVQEVITRASVISATFNIDFLQVIENQVWLGSRSDNPIYFSKNTSVTDYSFSSPRAPGEGGKVTLDGPGRGVGVLKGDVILFGGDFIYKSIFNQITVGTTLAETIKVQMVKTTSRQGAQHQNLIANIGNGLIWIGVDNVMHELIDAVISYNPDLQDVSDPVKPDFLATDFTGGHLKFDRTRVYISAPVSAINFIYEYRLNDKNQREWFWQPPQTLPIQRWAIIGGIIHGHSSATNETYKLFDGYNDNSKAIHSVALLARWNGGIRDMLKGCDEMFNEGAISPNTTISVQYAFDKDGGEFELINKQIIGTDEDILFTNFQSAALGDNPDGDISLEGDVVTTTNLQKFRAVHETNEQEFFDYGVLFETNDIDYRWEILAHGSNSVLSNNKVTATKV